MARFAPVCPIHILDKLLARSKLSSAVAYHLPLAHDVLAHPKEYAETFKQFSKYFSKTIILDNSVIELGHAVDKAVVLEAAKIVGANVIVLPDVLLDCDATIDSCLAALDIWTAYFGNRLFEYSFMIVPQGKTPGEFARCAEAFADDMRIGWWGIPRNYNIKGLGSRREAIDIVRVLNKHRNIHLLGFSDDIVDDVLSARHHAVSGIDSAVPIRAASLGLRMSMGLDADLPSRGKWWDDPNTKFNELMLENYRQMIRWVAQ